MSKKIIFKNTLLAIIVIFAFSITNSCDLVEHVGTEAGLNLEVPEDDPVPDGPPPSPTIMSGPFDESVLSEQNVSFRWNISPTENADEIVEYQYKLNGHEEWSSWSTNHQSVNYDYLEEKSYRFSLRSRYQKFATLGVSYANRINFEVDAINGPSVIFQPSFVDIGPNDDRVQSAIFLEEVSGVLGAKVVISFNENNYSLNWIDLETSLNNGNTDIISVVDKSRLEKGVLSINFAFAGGSGYSGSAKVMDISFIIKEDAFRQGQHQINIDGTSQLRDTDNSNLSIRERQPLRVQF